MNTGTKVKDKSAYYPTIVGREDGRWDAIISDPGRDENKVHVEHCEWVLSRATNGEERFQIKAYYTGEARDCDGWLLRTFQMDVERPHIDYAESEYIAGSGYVESVNWLTPEETEAEGFIEDERVDSCFPPAKIGVEKTTGIMGAFIKVAFVLRLRDD